MNCRIAWDKEIECNECGICAGKIIPISAEMPIGKIEWAIEEVIEAGIEMEIEIGEKIEIKLIEIKDIHDEPIYSKWDASEEIIDEFGGEITEIPNGIIIKI